MYKIVVYTAIFNNYDWLKEPVHPSPDIDYICYTDSDNLRSKNWRVVKVDLNSLTPSLLNRKIKLLYPYTELADFDYSLYVDGSTMIKGDVTEFLKKYIEGSPVIMNFKHPNNDCIYKEIDRCISGGWNKEKLELQRGNYRTDGMPEHFGLSDNKIILRDNHSELGKKMMEEWFGEVMKYSGRDQTCLSYVFFKNGRKYSFFEESIEKNEYFETWPHNKSPWFMQAWRHTKWKCEKNRIGRSIMAVLNDKVKPIFLRYYLAE